MTSSREKIDRPDEGVSPAGCAGSSAGTSAVPWYATPLEPGVRREALRPVPEDEVEELDDDLSAYDLTAWWLRPDGHRAVAAIDAVSGTGTRSSPGVDAMPGTGPRASPGTGIASGPESVRESRPDGPASPEARPYGPASPEAGRAARGRRPLTAAAASLHVSRRLGPAIKARRWRLGESQGTYARRTRRAQSLVSVLERGRRPLSLTELIEIAVETGRTVRLDILPDRAGLDVATERVTETTLGATGVVRVARPGARSGRRGARGRGPAPVHDLVGSAA
jgi:hypothetical protein